MYIYSKDNFQNINEINKFLDKNTDSLSPKEFIKK